jgi:hypothetical protein
MQTLVADHVSPSQIEDAGLFDAARVHAFFERYWQASDPVQGARDDVVFNHLVGLHLLHQELASDS